MGKKSKAPRQQLHAQADGSRAMDSRPTHVEVLSTWTAARGGVRPASAPPESGRAAPQDSAPALLVCADSERVAFNAPEGWQRLCVERGVKAARGVD